MIYWFFIILGVLILSISLSNPVYNLFFKKVANLKVLFQYLIRILLFFIGVILVFAGLYIESLF